MKKLIFGIDGGGTKSHMAVFDQCGQCVTIGKRGSLNHENMKDSFTQLEKELSAFIKDTLAGIGAAPTDVAYAVMGIAGVDTLKQHATISAMVDRVGLPHYILCNDALLGVPAGCADGVGICAINGTGSSLAAIDHRNVTVQMGGIGYISNEAGGSGWFGTKLLGAVYGELFKCEPKTIMTAMIFERLGISDVKDYIEKITSCIEDGSVKLNELNLMLFKAVALNDPVALDALRESAEHYAGGIAHLAKTMDFPADQTLSVTLAGSGFVKEKTRTLPDLVADGVTKRLPGRTVEYHKLQTAPVAGAVHWASKEAGCKMEIEAIAKSLAEAGL